MATAHQMEVLHTELQAFLRLGPDKHFVETLDSGTMVVRIGEKIGAPAVIIASAAQLYSLALAILAGLPAVVEEAA